MDNAWTRRADNATAIHVMRMGELEAQEDGLKKSLCKLDEAHAIIQETMHMILRMSGEAFPAGSATFDAMYEESAARAGRSEYELDTCANDMQNELKAIRRHMEEEQEAYRKAMRALDEETRHQ